MYACVCVCVCVCARMCVCVHLPLTCNQGLVLATLMISNITYVSFSQLRAFPKTELAISQRVADGTEGVMHSQPASDTGWEGTEVGWRWGVQSLCCTCMDGLTIRDEHFRT
jgi:hypothetical protein